MSELRDLVGKRVGTNEWPATGNTWSRAVLREAGIKIESINWWVGLIAGASAGRPQGDLPPYVQEGPPNKSLTQMLLDGDLDALMSQAPKEFYEPNSPIVRLIPDYRRAEQEYLRRTGIYPAHHIVGIRSELFDREPWVARSLYLALDESKRRWQESRRKLTDTTPWVQADVEESTALIGQDWSPSGVEPNRKTIQTLCDELHAQGLVAQPIDSAIVFREFERVMGGTAAAARA
jgi:4,5-dihydroxyphthalate decarboxylase